MQPVDLCVPFLGKRANPTEWCNGWIFQLQCLILHVHQIIRIYLCKLLLDLQAQNTRAWEFLFVELEKKRMGFGCQGLAVGEEQEPHSA